MYVGRDIKRIDALEKVLGRAKFAADYRMDGMLYGVLYRTEMPHAKIKSIDLRAAMSTPGVVKILSYKDIPGKNAFGVLKKDQPYLAEDRVRYVGEPILLILAEREQIARDAAKKIKVEYESLDVILDPHEAPHKGLIHPQGNLLSLRRVIKGDVTRGFEEADIIVEGLYKTARMDHAFLECEAGLGYMDEKGRIVVMASTQNIHYKQRELAALLAMPVENIRVVQTTTGGGFGGKLDVTVEGYIALGVYHTKRPVMVRYTREESMLSNTKRHPLFIRYKSGAKKDGTITAVEVDIVGDTGAYASYGDVVALRAAVHATGPYEVPNVSVRSAMYYTNNPVSGAMRGFGIPQMAFAHESQMDQLAERLGIDPLEIRIKNGLKKGSKTATGQVLLNSVGFLETLSVIQPIWRSRNKGSHNGFGIGSMFYGIGNTGVPNPSTCHIELKADGTIHCVIAACDIGQGSSTVLYQILMETLKLDPSHIQFTFADSEASYDVGSTSASRQTYITGKALFNAASLLKSYLEEKGFDGTVEALKGICQEAVAEGKNTFIGSFDPPTTPLDPETGQGIPYATYAFATHLTQVEVDPAGYVTSVKKVWAAHDVGRVVNPNATKGQIYGGIAMGIGMALMEEYIPGRTKNLNNYYIPTSKDIPEVEVFLIEDPEPTGPYGAKGVGEPALIPQAASIINAIRDAVGIRAFELPCNFERLRLLKEATQ